MRIIWPHSMVKVRSGLMETALATAEESPSAIDYISPHATSTPLGDDFGSRRHSPFITCCLLRSTTKDDNGQSQRWSPTYVSSTKGATGHFFGWCRCTGSGVHATKLTWQWHSTDTEFGKTTWPMLGSSFPMWHNDWTCGTTAEMTNCRWHSAIVFWGEQMPHYYSKNCACKIKKDGC